MLDAELDAIRALLVHDGDSPHERKLQQAVSALLAEREEMAQRLDGLDFAYGEQTEEVRTLEVRLMAARTARRQVEANHERWRLANQAAATTAGERIRELEGEVATAVRQALNEKAFADGFESRLMSARGDIANQAERIAALEAELAQLKQPAHVLAEAERARTAGFVDAINWLGANGHDVAGRALLAHAMRDADSRGASTMGGCDGE